MELWLPIIRHALQALAGALTTRGLIDGSMEEAIVGLGVSVATILWYYLEQRRKKAKPDEDQP